MIQGEWSVTEARSHSHAIPAMQEEAATLIAGLVFANVAAAS